MPKTCSTTGCEREPPKRRSVCAVCGRAYAAGHHSGRRRAELDASELAQARSAIARVAELEAELALVRGANRLLRSAVGLTEPLPPQHRSAIVEQSA